MVMSGEALEQEKEIQKVKMRVRAKFPLLGVTMSSLQIIPDERAGTAYTDGEKIVYSPTFFSTLSDKEKQFVFAHEVLHVAFNHILRSKDRDHRLWNIATDAVINQILVSENLPLVEGGVDIPEAINYSAEEMYKKLLEEKEQKHQNGDEQSNENFGGDNDNCANEDQVGHDTHEIWKEVVRKVQQQEQQKQQSQPQSKAQAQDEQGNKDSSSLDENMDVYEKGFLEKNRKKRNQLADKKKQELTEKKEKYRQTNGYSSLGEVGEVGEPETPVANWKRKLKHSLFTTKEMWSFRRSCAANDYASRIEDIEVEEYPDTEVMLDVSGSISKELLREFLRQLKPLLKSSKLKVACFDEFVYDFKEIKTKEDIDHFQITAKSQWTENWDAAVRAFSKKKEVNKIIFTDGYPCPGTMPKEDLKGKNVIWLVYGNKDFNPCCGKVLYVPEKQFQSCIHSTLHSRGGR